MKESSKAIYKLISAFLLVTVMVIIFILSHQTATVSSETSGSLIELIARLFGNIFSQEAIRTAAHFCEFALLGFLMLNCIRAFTEKTPVLISVLLSWGYAWSDEIHQLFIPGRAFQFIDLAVDLGGIIMGVAVMRLVIYFIQLTYDR